MTKIRNSLQSERVLDFSICYAVAVDGLRKDLSLLLAQFPLDERTNSAAGNGDVRHGASLLNELVEMTANKSPMC